MYIGGYDNLPTNARCERSKILGSLSRLNSALCGARVAVSGIVGKEHSNTPEQLLELCLSSLRT